MKESKLSIKDTNIKKIAIEFKRIFLLINNKIKANVFKTETTISGIEKNPEKLTVGDLGVKFSKPDNNWFNAELNWFEMVWLSSNGLFGVGILVGNSGVGKLGIAGVGKLGITGVGKLGITGFVIPESRLVGISSLILGTRKR